jgi:hypothetical protein
MRRVSLVVAAAFLVLGLGACQQPDQGRSPEPGDGDATTLTPTDEATDDPTHETSEPDEPPSGTTDERVEAAVTDLAEQLDVDPADITVGALEEVTWGDGSIGCPEPDQMYTQALVPGARLILTVDGAEYAYHGEGDGALFWCQHPVEPVPSDDATA